MNHVKDKVIIITGGSSGFGLEAARILLEMGARIAITGRDPARLSAAEDELGANGQLLAVRADACKTDDWRTLLNAVVDYFPAPTEVPQISGIHPKTREEQVVHCSESDPLSALVFKIMTHIDGPMRYYTRIYSGMLVLYRQS